MPDFEVNDLGKLGLVFDQPAYQLPPEAWTMAENVRFHDNSVKKLLGRSEIFENPGVAPHFALYLVDPTQTWWLYTSLTKAYVWDGVGHTNVTRQSAGVDVNYTAVRTRDWNGTILGGVPILNNGADIPQFWANYNVLTKLANLTNWPSTLRAAVVRSFGPFLIALNVSKSGTRYPHMIKWSHPADPGSLPSSWDETDPTKDAGEAELPDAEAGLLMNGLPLRGQMILYKEASVWAMRIVGGQGIFAFNSFIEANGIVGPRAACISPDGSKHVCLMQDDLIIHDGREQQSLLTGTMRRYLMNAIDRQFYRNCFLFSNPQFNEVWVCFPSEGNENPDRAIVVPMNGGQVSEVTNIGFRNATVGAIDTTLGGIQWDSLTDTWNEVSGAWDNASRDRRQTIVCNPADTRFEVLDTGNTIVDTTFRARVQRVALAMTGKKRDGSPIVDFKQYVLYQRIWLKMRGGPVRVRLGTQETVDGSVTWSSGENFDPANDMFLDFYQQGRAIAIEIQSTGDVDWQIDGYSIEVAPLGRF